MLFMVSCGDDDDDDDATPAPSGNDTDNTDQPVGELVTISANITADESWSTGNTYVLDGRIAVESGATLSIEPGVVVKGETGEGANASALLIARGAKIMAEGTADAPIIFTTVLDDIEPGEIESPNLDEFDVANWGGLIILGNAPISADAEAVQIEGIPADDTNGLYGGTNASDNSGVLRYVSVRHGGANIGEGNEINGITLGGVGSGTTIEFVEVVANQDDGIEFFGGTVNVSNALVWAQQDDAFDVDQAYSGTIDNFVYIAGEESDHGLEIDGPEGTATAGFTMTNGTLKGLAAEIGDFRDGAEGDVSGLYIFGFPDPITSEGEGDLELDNDGVSANYAGGKIVFADFEITLASGATLEKTFVDKADNPTSRLGDDIAGFVTEVAEGANTVGADTSVFGWTFASASGALDF